MPTRLRLAMLAASLGLLFAAAPSTADTVPGTTAAAAISKPPPRPAATM